MAARPRPFPSTARLALGLTLSGVLLASSLASAADAPAAPDAKTAAVATVQKAIEACLMPDEDKAFDAYLQTIHPERKETTTAVRDIRRYSWKRFRKQCRHFIVGDDAKTLEVVRIVPDPVPPDAKTFKLFFKPVSQPRRMPAPMGMRRQGDGWLIDTNSM